MDLTTNYGLDDFNDYLAHHGILGMKWGVRRYQNKDGSLTSAGKKRYGATKHDGIKKYIDKKLKERKKQDSVSDEEKAIKEKEKLKEYLRKHPSKMPKYNKRLTKDDVNEIINNIEFDRRLKDIKRSEIDRGMRKVADISNYIGTFSTLLNNSKNLYNNTADIYNAFIDTGVIKDSEKMQKVGYEKVKDRSAIMQQLLKSTPEEVLRNNQAYTNDELKKYKDRISNLDSIYSYTSEGKKQNKNNKNGPSKSDFNDLKQRLEDLEEKMNNS